MKTENHRRACRIATAALLAVLLTGCIGYQLGSMLPPDITTVYVPRFINKTDEPLIENKTTQATIEELQMDGSLRVVDLQDADAVLQVTLKEYNLSPVSFKRNRETAATEYRITITAEIVFKRTKTNEVIVEYPRVRGDATFQVVGDMSSSKKRGLPEAAEDLAHNIVERIVETW